MGTRSVAAFEDRGFANLWLLGQGAFHFAQFDAETSELDLGVATSGEDESAVGEPPSQIAGSIEPGARCGRVGIRDEGRGGEVGSLGVIPRARTGPPMKISADGAQRSRSQVVIEQVNGRMQYRLTDWRLFDRQILALEVLGRRENDRFGGGRRHWSIAGPDRSAEGH